MLKKIICENSKQNRITLAYSFPFFIKDYEGFSEIIGEISMNKSAFGIGGKYTGTSIKERNISITIALKKDNILEKKKKIYQTFPLNDRGTLYYYEDDKAYKINYYVENVKPIESKVYYMFVISLKCPNPYFTDVNKTVLQMATWSPAFKFPLKISENKGIKFGIKNMTSMATINNFTNIEFGMTVIFIANDIVINPSLFNVNSREEMKIKKTMQAGDKIIVYTYRQNKNVIYISSNSEREENINNLMVYGSKFLQIHQGENTYRYNADQNVNNLEAIIEYFTEYEAV